MNTLWAPWRLEYILGEKEEGCVFCRMVRENDDQKNLILHRGKYHFIVMNAYPYNNGHLMVVPYSHTSSLSGWDDEEKLEFFELADIAMKLLKNNMNPDGFNTGMNLGEAAGAGIADHLHLQIVPRWSGDTNFMTVLAETRVVPEHIQTTYDKLRSALDEMKK
ncbi:MAG: HIT family protein [Methanotrichaceae archaeon]